MNQKTSSETNGSMPFFLRLYDKIVLGRPVLVLVIMAVLFSFFAYKIKDFRLDATEDSLILEGDPDLKLFRETVRRYGTNDYLLLTYLPKDDLLNPATLKTIRELKSDLEKLPRAKSVVTILDIPLLKSPPVTVKELTEKPRTLESDDVDWTLAREELKTSPICQEMLVSPDLKLTAIQINLIRDKDHMRLQAERSKLLDKKLDGTLTADEERELERLREEYKVVLDRVNQEKLKTVNAVRELKKKYHDRGQFFLGGVSMVTSDMMSFVRNDLKIFGFGMMLFIIVTLYVIFRRKRWVFLPVLCCTLSAIAMMGILGIFGWEVTVISSNFISLQLIVTMSLTIHLVVRYSELLRNDPEGDNHGLILETVRTIFRPCLYTSLTTIAGFSSLMVCDILPVINFGWMMSLGLCVSLLLVFTIFPAVLILMPKDSVAEEGRFGFSVTSVFAKFTERHGRLIAGIAIAIAVLIAVGIPRLRVENSFIDYFRDSTEIYQGMALIDKKLGGTTPLDVLIHIDEPDEEKEPLPEPEDAGGDDFGFDEFEEFEEPAKDEEKYWFTMQKMAKVQKVHQYLESQPAIGKVLSLEILLSIARDLNDGKELDNLTLALLFKELPDNFNKVLVDPYVSVDNNQIRLTMRIKDSMADLERDALLKKVEHDLVHEVGLKPGNVEICGIMVLYNNMLQSLFFSQIQTIGMTVAALLIMFLILFRSFKIALIAILPNLLACMSVLGLMGWANIPLDMMTITIVAISMGIAVDNTIHYIYRFRREIEVDHDYHKTMFRCHGSIGNAMYYTSVTIIVGFSILILSNFMPSVLFGVLTGVAMAMALLGSLTLLPLVLMTVKPFGKGK